MMSDVDHDLPHGKLILQTTEKQFKAAKCFWEREEKGNYKIEEKRKAMYVWDSFLLFPRKVSKESESKITCSNNDRAGKTL